MPSSSHASDFDSDSPRFSDASVSVSDWPAEPRLRGLRWRVLLGVLPPCPAPIESLRRAAANGRRRYAELRRRLIVDPHAMEDMQKGENLSVDNPLSQDPESIWGRYFKNAEIERTIESDLTRLYPENGSFFQSFVCQAMLRRILLVWALIHPQYGYRQGMHEVLAPLVYVLHMDVTHLSQVRQRYEDPFEGRFDTPLEDNISFGREGRQVVPSFSSRSARRISNESTFSGDEDWIDRVHPEDSALVEPDDFGFNLKTMVLGSDSYGAEGELGALLSGRFVEHDAYCMFDALLRGQGGAIVLADYFTAVHEVGTGLSPVLEASTAMYHTLAAVDMPLYIHLVGLGVEPQFFALRWLRVLFGREFDLEKLLLLWDAIFAASYSNVSDEESKQMSDVSTSSPQGSFISNFAVSMILYLRPTLLAAPNATGCLQKLLNFPKNVDIRNFIENAKVLQMHPEESLRTLSSPVVKYSRFFERSRGSRHKNGSCSPSFQAHIPAPSKVLQHRHSGSPEMIRPSFPESYWEERWMKSVLPKVVPEVLCGVSNVDTGATPSGSESSNVPGSNISQVTLVRDASRDNKSTQSAQSNGTSPVHNMDVTNRSTRHNLLTGILEEAAHLMGFENRRGDAYVSSSESKPASPVKASSKGGFINVTQSQVNTTCSAQLTEGNEGPSVGIASAEGSSEVAVSDFWTSDDGETSCSGDEGGKSRICYCTLDRSTDTIIDKPPSHEPEALECLRSSCNSGSHEESQQNSVRRHRIGKLSDSTGKEVNVDIATMNDLKNSDGTSKVTKEKHSRAALQTLGHSMVESIQVLESALSSLSKEGAPTVYRETAENISKAFLNGKGHVTALSALSELRKISSILLQM